MRRKHSVPAFEEIRVNPGLVLEHIETSGGYATFGERLRERSFINHGASRSVDQDRRRLHHLQLRFGDVVPGSGGERKVQADEVRFGEHPLFGCEFAGEIEWRLIVIPE